MFNGALARDIHTYRLPRPLRGMNQVGAPGLEPGTAEV